MSVSSKINQTTVTLIRRGFAGIERAEALSIFQSILDNADNAEATNVVRAETLKVFEAAKPGERISRETLLEFLQPLVGGEFIESTKALNETLSDVLQGAEFKGHKGRRGGYELMASTKTA